MFGCSSYINERREYDDIIKNAMLDEVPEINSFDDLKRVVDKMDRETQAVSTAINTLELTPGQISFIKAKLTQIRDDINKILDADIDDIGGSTTTAKEVTSIREVTSVRIQTLQRIQQITRVIEQRVERIERVEQQR